MHVIIKNEKGHACDEPNKVSLSTKNYNANFSKAYI